jgi:integral membrane sensor domain MASE1
VKYLRHAQEPTYSFVILTFLLILVNTALAWISVKFIPAGTGGIALVYIAVAFMILFTLWFGAYGAIAAYIGTFLGGVLTTESLLQHPEIAAIWAVAGLLQVLIPLVAVRMFEVDLTLAGRRDWTVILLFAVLINNVVGAAWGAYTLSLLPGSTVAVASIFSTWLVGNIIITLLIVPLALRFLTEKVNKSKLFVKKYWD